jgi:hypothetical protein
MAASDLDRMLELVWDMDVDVNMYLAGELAPSAMIDRVLEGCQQLRRSAVDDTADHQIEGLERSAKELSNLPGLASEPKRRRSPGPDESQLMQGLFDLRSQLLKTRGSAQ